ncbi:MAG: hypothetical protein R3Y66_00885 [Rikenellaceae bacterium]
MTLHPMDHYISRVSELSGELSRVKSITSRLYIVRLISFLAFISTFTLSFSGSYTALYVVVAILFLSLFVTVAIYDLRMIKRRQDLENRIEFNENELKTLRHDFVFREDGAQFTTLNPHLSGDFDIFGSGSLYQYLNRSVTLRGRSRFAASLVACELDRERIISRMEAIKELSSKMNFIEDFAAVGCEIKESGTEVENLLRWLKAEDSKELFINIIRFVLPAATFLVLLLSILGYVSFGLLSLTFFGSLIAVYFNTKKLNQAHSLLGRSAEILERYSKLISLIEMESFTSNSLSSEKRKLATEKLSASRSIKELKNILDRFDYRFNVYISVVLNGFLLFDYHTFMSLLKWRHEHRDIIEDWFDTVTQIDSLIGLGVYGYNTLGSTTYADILEGEFQISARGMGHPLLSPEVRVNNSIEIVGRSSIVIITGANMAGKSTFLRTLAVNLILGMNGAPICGESFAFTPIKLFSSIKIQDSLMNRESYFYAELLRLSEILEGTKSQPQSMIILDEILRGTNTRDKQQGSIGLLRKIIDQQGVAIIATHDLVIGKMEEEFPDIVSNYCFEVEIDGERLSFDYKLKNGISSKLNASFLMRQMGIID